MTELHPGQMVATTNPRYASLGLGFVLSANDDTVRVEFRPSVYRNPPIDSTVVTLSRAEVQSIKTPLERLMTNEFEEPWRFELRQRAAHLVVCNRDGQLGNSRTDLMPHQITLAHTIVLSPKRRFLIAEEVGLGKTIEAGLIIYALGLRGLAKRVLIVVPAGLAIQWQEEMEEKFGWDYQVYGLEVTGRRAFDNNNYLIASLETLRLDQARKQGKMPGHKTLALGSKHWDVIVFDEAHRLSAKEGIKRRVDKTLSFKLAEALQSRCETLLFLTGTPHRGDESKFQFLMSLLDTNVVFHSGPKKRDDVPYTQLILKNRKSQVTDGEGKPLFKAMVITPVEVCLAASGEREFHNALEGYLREGYGYAERDPKDKKHRAIGLVMTVFQKLAASSVAAITHSLKQRADRIARKGEESKKGVPPAEDDRYAGELETLRASEISDKFVDKELDMIQRVLGISVPEDSKVVELCNVVNVMSKDDSKKKFLIFTEYLKTQDYLVEQLAKRFGSGCMAIINGSMGLGEKLRNRERFRDNEDIRFLVSTEAGGEGVNLQFCHIMINYDLPWNPFRLAQRYGRLHRFGQKEVVHVFNFSYKDSIETKIRCYLETKTRTAAESLSRITGETIEEIERALLGTFDEFVDYERIYREGIVKRDLKPSQTMIDEAMKKAEEAYKLGFDLLSRAVHVFNPDRFKRFIQSPLDLHHVEQLVTEFLRRTSKRFRTGGRLYDFLTPTAVSNRDGVKSKYTGVTFDRELALRDRQIEFMAMGHPLTDAVVSYCGLPEMGGFACTRSIRDYRYSRTEGVHFNFVVTRRREAKSGSEIFFELIPVFVTWNGEVVEGAGEAALQAWGTREIPQQLLQMRVDRLENLYKVARNEVGKRFSGGTLVDEDILCLNDAVTRFV
jgi:superfamily II DNA or RNA helicase